jgi:hypothetical protein
MHRLLVAALLLSGCGEVDPCSGFDRCISARVEGNVTGLDQLRVTDVGQGEMLTPTTPAGFDLPVRLAILAPAGVTSLSLVVDGLHGGTVTASSGPAQDVTLGAGNPAASVVFTLTGDLGDGGGGDGPPPGVVSLSAATLDFGKANRGTTTMTKTITLTNNTSHAVMGTASSTQPPTDPFKLVSAPCLSGAMGMTVMVAAGESCDLGFQFAPTLAGSYQQDVTVAFDDGEMVGFSMLGQAVPVWSAESLPDGADLEAVWGSGHDDLYAVGHNASGGIYHSMGFGSWAHLGNNSNNCFSVSGVDAQHVFIGCDNASVLSKLTATTWRSSSPGGTSLVQGIWARDNTFSYAVFDTPHQIDQVNIDATSGNSTFLPELGAPAGGGFNGVCGAGGRVVAVNSDSSWWVSDTSGSNFMQQPNLFPTPNGCWMPDASHVYIVGDTFVGPNGEPMPGLLTQCVFSGGTWTCTAQTPADTTKQLIAISGRMDLTSGKLEIWVVGYLGNEVLFSDGSGTWQTVPTPQNQAMKGVWVNPAGNEVVTVGFQGLINHLY